ncbi:hypothetical protein BaRGS_00024597 [Batillaria attramentaria]|uniref:Uncharacterized protein n=1 Tax=Batillaria attramentaria TaxID=370345 RepID=A0ABD0KAI8_9CAEN
MANLAERPPATGYFFKKQNYQATSRFIKVILHGLSSMEKRVVVLLNSSKSGNIFDKESKGIWELIKDYFASSSTYKEENYFPHQNDEEEDVFGRRRR